MVVSSSNFRPHVRSRFILYRSNNVHGTEAPAYSDHPSEAGVSTYLAILFGWIDYGIP